MGVFTCPLRTWHKRGLAEINSVFLLLYSLPYQDERNQSGLLFTHSWRLNSWIHTFPRVLALFEIQAASTWIWTRVVMSISNYDNPYTTVICMSGCAYDCINMLVSVYEYVRLLYICVCVCVCVNRIWYWITRKVWYAIKSNNRIILCNISCTI